MSDPQSFDAESTSKLYQLTPAFLLFSLQICVLRGLRHGHISTCKAKSEEDAVYILRSIIDISRSNGKLGLEMTDIDASSGVKLAAFLAKHSHRCFREECQCHDLLLRANESRNDFLQGNLITYHSLQNVPEFIRKSWKLSTLKILMNDLFKKYNKCDEIQILAAEVYFLLLGNHYQALTLISNIYMQGPTLLMKLRLYYLREIVNMGMMNSSQESLTLLDSLEYQDHFQHFLRDAEEIAELTIKFWRHLLLDTADNVVLNAIGGNIFRTRKKLMETINQINLINKNNTEFFVKCGLFMRCILHDVVAASMAFNNLMRTVESVVRTPKDRSMFSLLQSSARISLVIISFDSADFMAIDDINTEVEYLLGYTREELIGSSVTNLMHPLIGQQHHQYVQQYFQTMETTNIGVPRVRFLKNKDGMYVTCRVMKYIVPKLSHGFQGMMMAIPDARMTKYTSGKKDPTAKKVLDFRFIQDDRSEHLSARRI
jgi:PAS domain S-box-containing protein